jgi:putative NADH-flavin reductase
VLEVDWNDPQISVGKAVYRELTDGRWVVSVTGDGSLGLALADDEESLDLPPMPDVKEYEAIAQETQRLAEAISVGDVFDWVFGSGN